MAIHRLDFDDFDQMDYSLVAIHTSMEDYRLAYFINKKLHINLSKIAKDIQITSKHGEAHFSRFHYYEQEKEISWDLIQNKNEVLQEQNTENQSLFSHFGMEVAMKVFMLPEFKMADYFLKIEHHEDPPILLEQLQILNTIEHVSTTYIIDTDTVKSKNNLIF